MCSTCGESSTTKTCGIKMTGKNSSNLVAHLRRFHPKAFTEYTQKEGNKKSLLSGSKTMQLNTNARSQSQTYKLIFPIAVDLLSAPASQAFVERIFSLCGLLSAGRRNRMHRSMEMRAFLKLNASLID